MNPYDAYAAANTQASAFGDTLSGGLVDFGPSDLDLRRDALEQAIRWSAGGQNATAIRKAAATFFAFLKGAE